LFVTFTFDSRLTLRYILPVVAVTEPVTVGFYGWTPRHTHTFSCRTFTLRYLFAHTPLLFGLIPRLRCPHVPRLPVYTVGCSLPVCCSHVYVGFVPTFWLHVTRYTFTTFGCCYGSIYVYGYIYILVTICPRYVGYTRLICYVDYVDFARLLFTRSLRITPVYVWIRWILRCGCSFVYVVTFDYTFVYGCSAVDFVRRYICYVYVAFPVTRWFYLRYHVCDLICCCVVDLFTVTTHFTFTLLRFVTLDLICYILVVGYVTFPRCYVWFTFTLRCSHLPHGCSRCYGRCYVTLLICCYPFTFTPRLLLIWLRCWFTFRFRWFVVDLLRLFVTLVVRFTFVDCTLVHTLILRLRLFDSRLLFTLLLRWFVVTIVVAVTFTLLLLFTLLYVDFRCRCTLLLLRLLIYVVVYRLLVTFTFRLRLICWWFTVPVTFVVYVVRYVDSLLPRLFTFVTLIPVVDYVTLIWFWWGTIYDPFIATFRCSLIVVPLVTVDLRLPRWRLRLLRSRSLGCCCRFERCCYGSRLRCYPLAGCPVCCCYTLGYRLIYDLLLHLLVVITICYHVTHILITVCPRFPVPTFDLRCLRVPVTLICCCCYVDLLLLICSVPVTLNVVTFPLRWFGGWTPRLLLIYVCVVTLICCCGRLHLRCSFCYVYTHLRLLRCCWWWITFIRYVTIYGCCWFGPTFYVVVTTSGAHTFTFTFVGYVDLRFVYTFTRLRYVTLRLPLLRWICYVPRLHTILRYVDLRSGCCWFTLYVYVWFTFTLRCCCCWRYVYHGWFTFVDLLRLVTHVLRFYTAHFTHHTHTLRFYVRTFTGYVTRVCVVYVYRTVVTFTVTFTFATHVTFTRSPRLVPGYGWIRSTLVGYVCWCLTRSRLLRVYGWTLRLVTHGLPRLPRLRCLHVLVTLRCYTRLHVLRLRFVWLVTRFTDFTRFTVTV